jgi:hypothetical protein
MVRSLERLSWLVIFITVLPFIVTRLETKFFPIITPLTIESVEAIGPNTVRVKGSAERLRSCTFVELEWYLGRRGEQSTKVQVGFDDAPEVRNGKTHWSGIIVGLKPESLINNSHADVRYKCWGDIFPETVQPWYNGNGKDNHLIYEQKLGVME